MLAAELTEATKDTEWVGTFEQLAVSHERVKAT